MCWIEIAWRLLLNWWPLSGSIKKIASVTLQREELWMNPSRGHYCIVCCRLLYDIVMIFQHWQSGQDRCLWKTLKKWERVWILNFQTCVKHRDIGVRFVIIMREYGKTTNKTYSVTFSCLLFNPSRTITNVYLLYLTIVVNAHVFCHWIFLFVDYELNACIFSVVFVLIEKEKISQLCLPPKQEVQIGVNKKCYCSWQECKFWLGLKNEHASCFTNEVLPALVLLAQCFRVDRTFSGTSSWLLPLLQE